MSPGGEADARTAVAARAAERLARVLGRRAEAVAVAPGRVNLIGEHTDYNDGFVLPMALDRYVALAYARSDGARLRIDAELDGATRDVPVDAAPSGRRGDWSDYVAGLLATKSASFGGLVGLDGALVATLPAGAGLSSSAALTLAVARALVATAGAAWEPLEAARWARRAEHAVGVACGVMDPLVIAAGRRGAALFVDCRDLRCEPVPLPESLRVVVMDTATRRALVGGAYNERRRSCERAVATLRRLDPSVGALRDVDVELLERARGELDPVVWRRARHVVEENARVAAMAEALAAGDARRAGALLDASHESLRRLYEVSSPELDRIVELARCQPGCLGARMTGAGFGGAAIAFVEPGGVETFCADVEGAYRRETGLEGRLFPCRAVDGVGLVRSTAEGGW